MRKQCKQINRLLSLVLCLCMVLSLMPMSALAVDLGPYEVRSDGSSQYFEDIDEAAAAACAAEEATLILGADVGVHEYNLEFNGGNVTLDLNGYTVERAVYTEADTLILKDSGNGAGTIVLGYATIIYKGGKLILDESVDLLGKTEGHRPLDVYSLMDDVTIGPEDTNDIVIPEGILAMKGSQQVTEIDQYNTVVLHQHNWREASCLHSGGCAGCGADYEPMLEGHNVVDGKCTLCGTDPEKTAYIYLGSQMDDWYDFGVAVWLNGELLDTFALAPEDGIEAGFAIDYEPSDDQVYEFTWYDDDHYFAYGCAFELVIGGETVFQWQDAHYMPADEVFYSSAEPDSQFVAMAMTSSGQSLNLHSALEIWSGEECLGSVDRGPGGQIKWGKLLPEGSYVFKWARGQIVEGSPEISINGEIVWQPMLMMEEPEDGEVVYTICGHTYDEGVEKDANCLKPGGLFRTCTQCGDLVIEGKIEALGHAFDEDGICSRCGGKKMSATVNWWDSYGDGWNGAFLEVYSNGVLLDTLSPEDGDEGEWSLELAYEGLLEFVWFQGGCDYETGFEIQVDGVTVYEIDDCSTLDHDVCVYAVCDHILGEGVETEATCTQPGGIYYTCTKCGGVVIEDETEALGHAFDEDGSCSRCGGQKRFVTVNWWDSYGDGWNDAALEVYSNGVLLGTLCPDEGEAGEWSQELVAVGDLEFVWCQGADDQECGFEIQVDGIHGFTIDNCEDLKHEEVVYTACGHIFGEGVERDPTCILPGGIYCTCTKCGGVKIKDKTEALGHALGEDGVCSRCGFTEEITITIHMEDDYEDGWNGAGIGIYADGEPFDVAAMDDGYEQTLTFEVTADELEFKWIPGDYDSECSFEILINGRLFLEVDDASSLEPDESVATFTVCDHTYGFFAEKEVTCTQSGGLYCTCTKCGDVMIMDEIEAPGHDLDENDTCRVCGRPELIITINMEGEYADSWIASGIGIYADGEPFAVATIDEDVYEPTLTFEVVAKELEFQWLSDDFADECSFEILIDGKLLFKTDDASTLESNEIFATFTACDHTYGDGVEQEATCSQPGGIYYTCTKCGDVMIKDRTPLLPHNYGTDDVCDVCGSDDITVTINMYDSCGDGWSGDHLELFKLPVGDTDEGETFTLEDGEEGTWTCILDRESAYGFMWVCMGEDCSHSECSFEVLLNGKKVFQVNDCSRFSQQEVPLFVVDKGVFMPMVPNDYSAVTVAGVALEDGEYLDLEGNVTDTKPQGGYAYFSDGILTLCDFEYEGAGLVRTVTEGSLSVAYGTLIAGNGNDLELKLLGTNDLVFTGTVGFGILLNEMALDIAPMNAVLTVSGTGTLNLSGEGCYLAAQSMIIINGGIINAVIAAGIDSPVGDSELVINGGELNIQGARGAIRMGNMTVNGGKVTLSSEDIALRVVGHLTVNGGSLEVLKGGYDASIHNYDEEAGFLTLGEGVSIVSPEGAYTDGDYDQNNIFNGTIYDAEGNPADAFLIQAENHAEPASILAKSATLLYKDMIQIRYTFQITGEDVVECGLCTFETVEEGQDLTLENADRVTVLIPGDGDIYYGYSDGIAAKNMGESQFVTGYIKLSDGSYLYSDVIEYSPRIYAQRMVAKKTSTPETIRLCNALMQYGAAAQLYFGYKTDELMNEGFEAVEYDASVMGESVFHADTALTNGFAAKAVTLLFEGAITYRVKYTVSDDIADKELFLEYTFQGETDSVELQKIGSFWYGYIDGIAAKDLDETITVKPYYLDENGEQVYGGELVYSGYEYARRTIANTSGDPKAADLAEALAMYIDAADLAIRNENP